MRPSQVFCEASIFNQTHHVKVKMGVVQGVDRLIAEIDGCEFSLFPPTDLRSRNIRQVCRDMASVLWVENKFVGSSFEV